MKLFFKKKLKKRRSLVGYLSDGDEERKLAIKCGFIDHNVVYLLLQLLPMLSVFPCKIDRISYFYSQKHYR